MRSLALALPFVALVCGCSSSSLPGGSLQSMLTDQVSSSTQVPGAVLGVSRGGERWVGAAGLADQSTGEAMKATMRFRIASLTKHFTAALLLKLAEEGKLSLDDTVRTWLPGLEFPNDDRITIRMLLSHTSGVAEFADESFWRDHAFAEPSRAWTSSEIIALAKAGTPAEPGSAFAYCNTNYVLAGLIAEAASGETASAAMKRRFFEPLGMTQTELATDATFTGTRAHGHLLLDGAAAYTDTTDWNPSYAWTAGAILSTADDLLTWAEALFDGRVIQPASLTTMLTPVSPSPDYGLGLGLTTVADGRSFAYHTGQIPGFRSALGHHRESGLTVVVLTNREDVLAGTNDVVGPVFNAAVELLP